MLLAITRYDVALADASAFRAQAETALAVLCRRPGCLSGQVARALDDTDLWVMATTWGSVGAYRRALSHPEVKTHAVPLMYRCRDEPSAFEVLLETVQGVGSDEAAVCSHGSDVVETPPEGDGAR